MGYQRTMFRVGPVHVRDHGSGCSVASVRNRPERILEVVLIYMPIQKNNRKEGASTPLEYLETLR